MSQQQYWGDGYVLSCKRKQRIDFGKVRSYTIYNINGIPYYSEASG